MSGNSIARWVALLLGVAYLGVFATANWLLPVEYIACNSYTRQMKGGLKKFDGKYFDIVLCGQLGGISPDWGRHDRVRLQVFSADGELLAVRYFTPLVGVGGSSHQLEYDAYHLRFNDGDEVGRRIEMTMPPSQFEWVQARLPRFVLW